MDPKEKELMDKFLAKDIGVFYGKPTHSAGTDFWLYDVENLIDFCSLNDIYSVFFDCHDAQAAENQFAQLKSELENNYKSRVNGYVTGDFKLPHIDQAFYAPVWEKIASAFDSEFPETGVSSQINRENTLSKILVWAFYQGIRLYTVVDFSTEEQSRNEAQQRAMKQKYSNMLLEELSRRRQEAYQESKRIEQNNQQIVLDEIAQLVHQDRSLDSLVTVKARNDYADRICVTWQMERGYEWLTKKAVRSIVEVDYIKRTS